MPVKKMLSPSARGSTNPGGKPQRGLIGPCRARGRVASTIGQPDGEGLRFHVCIECRDRIDGRTQAERRIAAQVAGARGHGKAQRGARLVPGHHCMRWLAGNRHSVAAARLAARQHRGSVEPLGAEMGDNAVCGHAAAQEVACQFLGRGWPEDRPPIARRRQPSHASRQRMERIRGRGIHVHAHAALSAWRTAVGSCANNVVRKSTA